MSLPPIAFVAAKTQEAEAARRMLMRRYQHVEPSRAKILVALGGDGFMLEVLSHSIDRDVAVYGMNRGSVGFLMNEYRVAGLTKRLARAARVTLRPLEMRAVTLKGRVRKALAINEVALLRMRHQTANLAIDVNGVERLERLVCDGVLIASPAGSTAYNLSAAGPIIPIGAPLLALTPISPFRPRRWRGALLPDGSEVAFRVLEPEKRPVAASADSFEVRDVASVTVRQSRDHHCTLMFDPEHNLEERILREQFMP
ncbi:MAG: NAD kinase [Rhodospirillaceae bacterium]|nr:NAD kinase [Rhodospirillaceae bacterium]